MKQFSNYDEIKRKLFSVTGTDGTEYQEAAEVLNDPKTEPAIPKEEANSVETVPIPLYPTDEYEIVQVPAKEIQGGETVSELALPPDVPEPELALPPDVPSPEHVRLPNVCINYAKVRIFNAAANYVPLNVSVGSRVVAEELMFGKVSDYQRIIDGYRSVTVFSSVTGAILAHAVLPFMAESKITLAIINTAGGPQLIPVSDAVCRSKMKGKNCFRVANLTYDDGPFDVALCNGCVAFSDVRTKEVTPWKQAIQGEYDFYVLDTMYQMEGADDARNSEGLRGYEVMEEMPELPFREINEESILDFFVKMNGDTIYTAYLIGGYYPSVPLRAVIVEN